METRFSWISTSEQDCDKARIDLKIRIGPNEITVDDPDGHTFGFIQGWDAK